jgi:hypothetical protein
VPGPFIKQANIKGKIYWRAKNVGGQKCWCAKMLAGINVGVQKFWRAKMLAGKIVGGQKC